MVKVTKREIADLIVRFVDGSVGDHEWDDFISVRFKDPEIEAIRIKVLKIEAEYPPPKAPLFGLSPWCSDAGGQALKQLAEDILRSKDSSNR